VVAMTWFTKARVSHHWIWLVTWRENSSIEAWVRKRMGSRPLVLRTESDVTELLGSGSDMVIFAVFNNANSEEAKVRARG